MRKGNKWEFVTNKNNKKIVMELDEEVNFKNDGRGKYILKHLFYGNSMGKPVYPTKIETQNDTSVNSYASVPKNFDVFASNNNHFRNHNNSQRNLGFNERMIQRFIDTSQIPKNIFYTEILYFDQANNSVKRFKFNGIRLIRSRYQRNVDAYCPYDFYWILESNGEIVSVEWGSLRKSLNNEVLPFPRNDNFKSEYSYDRQM